MIEISIKECKKAFDNEKVGEKLTQLASKRFSLKKKSGKGFSV